jgi:hypothetical protein
MINTMLFEYSVRFVFSLEHSVDKFIAVNCQTFLEWRSYIRLPKKQWNVKFDPRRFMIALTGYNWANQ